MGMIASRPERFDDKTLELPHARYENYGRSAAEVAQARRLNTGRIGVEALRFAKAYSSPRMSLTTISKSLTTWSRSAGV